MRFLVLFALVAVPAAAQQKVYSWEDEEGVHFTDDVNQVPREARNVETTKQEDPVVIRPQPVVAAPVATVAATRPSQRLDERSWRDRFVMANRRIATIQQSIRALESTLPPRTECIAQPVRTTTAVMNTNGPQVTVTPVPQVVTGPARCRVNPLYDNMKVQIAQEQVRLRDAELDLEQLERQASYDGVPREWRRGW